MPQTATGFTYERKNDHILITELFGNPEIVEVPPELDGLPVTELGPYLFSGKNCRIIRIPGSVVKIGIYGFYNCRSLESLSFSSNFTDLGSGAFTGCHHIRSLEVEMQNAESGLKEVLSEIREELCVRLTGVIDAVLWFPEYYEEGVENTPARILMTHVHGSGLYYRNCFLGKAFHFTEYDRRFEHALAQESPDFLRELVFGRLSHPWELTGEAKNRYENYLQANYEKIAMDFIRQKREEELGWLLNTYPLSENCRPIYQKILETAAECGTLESRSMIMEYGRIHFPAKRRSFEL